MQPHHDELRPPQASGRLLIVDDDAELLAALGRSMSDWGFVCELASSAEKALEAFQAAPNAVDVVLADVCLGPGAMTGLELLARVRRIDERVPVIVMTGMGSVPAAVEAMRGGAFHYVTKPLEALDARAIVERALAERSLPGKPRTPSSPPESSRARAGVVTAATIRAELVTRSETMQRLRERIDLVAASSAPVLVLGESGSGKELVARALHAFGPRRTRPFVAVNAAAVPETLLESEIFGHARGAFTGATQSRRGLAMEAEGGTLLLDEVGDMPVALQPKLLRMLQTGEVRAVGSDSARHADVRVIAATHRELPALIADGRFREDLYYRLNVLPIFVPPLRSRREDIPELAARFLDEARERAPSSPVKGFTEEALATLGGAAWPGNVRQLASVVEQLVVLGRDERIGAKEVAAALGAEPATAPWSDSGGEPVTLKRLNERYVAWVLAQSGGNKAQAAKVLGIDLSTLYRWRRPKKD